MQLQIKSSYINLQHISELPNYKVTYPPPDKKSTSLFAEITYLAMVLHSRYLLEVSVTQFASVTALAQGW